MTEQDRILLLAVEQAEVSIVITDLEGNIQYVNPKFEKVTGYTSAEVMGKNQRLLKSGKHSDKVYQELWTRIISGKAWHGELQNRRKNGSLYWERQSISPILDSQGSLTNFVAVKQDITELRAAEQELQLAAKAFESNEGMVICDRQVKILRVNHAFTELTGYSAAEVIGRTPKMLSSGYHPPEFYQAMWQMLERNGHWQGEIWNRRKSGEIYPERLTITGITDATGEISHYVGTFIDITLQKDAEEKLRVLAFYDPLTDLPNRRLLRDRLGQAVANSARSRQYGAILLIDLDHFKILNDTQGHEVGDMLLKDVAQRLLACVREGDTVARMGGDEFVVMLEDLGTDNSRAAARAALIAEKVCFRLSQPYMLGSSILRKEHSACSIGVCMFCGHDLTLDDLLKHADFAMYRAKAADRNTVRFFDPSMQTALEERAHLESELRCALDLGQLTLYYQAQVDSIGRMFGAEALLRWQHPERGLVSPAQFIPLVEETGLILPIGQWVLETACKQLVAWAEQPDTVHLSLAVNVSAKQFRQADFVDQVANTLVQTGANAENLKLELTESLLLDDVEDTITKMLALQVRGVSFSLDDFGTGYSSLAYLRRLPLNQLKIDQSFVRDLQTDQNASVISRAIIGLAHSLGLEVIAEGVETLEQRDLLASHGCAAYQGYLFGKPGPVEEMMSRRRP